MNIRHPGQLNTLESWGLSWSYQLKDTANLAIFLGKWGGLAALSSW